MKYFVHYYDWDSNGLATFKTLKEAQAYIQSTHLKKGCYRIIEGRILTDSDLTARTQTP